MINPFNKIFPNGNLERFKRRLTSRTCKGDVEFALYCSGLWSWELEGYKKEVKEIKLWIEKRWL